MNKLIAILILVFSILIVFTVYYLMKKAFLILYFAVESRIKSYFPEKEDVEKIESMKTEDRYPEKRKWNTYDDYDKW